MADARHRFWHLAAPLAAGIVLASAAPGCGDGNATTGTGATAGTGGTGATGGTGGATTSTGGGTTGGTGGATTSTGGSTTSTGGSTGGGSATVDKIADALTAIDSTPDSAAEFIYFSGVKKDTGTPGIFKVGAMGGAITDLFVGDPLAAPVGISITSDDKTLFVADTGYDTTPGDADTPLGAILSLGIDPSTPKVLTGTEGYKPRGLDIFPEGGGDTIYFTGVDPASGDPGVFSLLAAGGAVKTVAAGKVFVDPSGIAVGKTQTFVTDAIASDEKMARVVVIDKGGDASIFLDTLSLGYPAGVSLTMDEKTLILSGIDLATGFDRVLLVDVATKVVTPYGDKDVNVKDNTDAGGLHRARKSDVFSWADLTAGTGSGAVYRISFK